MPKTRPPYSPEFRRQMVDLVRADRDPTDLAREFEPFAQAIRNWVTQTDRLEGRRGEKASIANRGLSAAERDEPGQTHMNETQICGTIFESPIHENACSVSYRRVS